MKPRKKKKLNDQMESIREAQQEESVDILQQSRKKSRPTSKSMREGSVLLESIGE